MRNNILITRHDKIGDFVVSLPMFKVLKSQRPNLKLHALVSKINYDFAKSIDFIDEVILYDKNNLDKTLLDIRKAKIDVSISAFIDTNLAWLLFKSRIKTRIAPATKIAQLFFNKRIKQRRSRVEKREFEYNLDLLKAYDKNLKLEYNYPLLELNSEKKSIIFDEFLKENSISKNSNIVALHPGFGGSSDGNLTLEDYLKLAKSISKKENTKVVFTFGPDDLQTKKEIEKLLDFEAVLYESKGSILDFCILLENFTLFISTSTGPMHLSAISNSQTISFFGENLFATPKRWASINEEKNQHNFIIPHDYNIEIYEGIENCVGELLNEK